jgi:predicted enzyme related to lactoylglutathione lyase
VSTTPNRPTWIGFGAQSVNALGSKLMEIFGWNVQYWPGYAILRAGDVEVGAVHAVPDVPFDTATSHVEVEDCAGIHARAVSGGCESLQGPTAVPGAIIATIRLPGGAVLGLRQPVSG